LERFFGSVSRTAAGIIPARQARTEAFQAFVLA